MDSDVKLNPEATRKSVEAILFASGEPVSVERISRILDCRRDAVRTALSWLQQDYSERESSLEILNVGSESFVMQIRGPYSRFARKVSSKLPISVGSMKTLSLVAMEQPITQSRVIQIRGKHAYKYVRELVRVGYITSEKVGRTSVLNTSDRFNKLLGVDDAKSIKRILQSKMPKQADGENRDQEGEASETGEATVKDGDR